MSYRYPMPDQDVNISNVDIADGKLSTDTRLEDKIDRLLMEMKINNFQLSLMTDDEIKETDIIKE